MNNEKHLNNLYKCIETKKANQSHAREAIFRVLEATEGCLTVSQIIDALSSVYPKKISLNTVYRHLNLFVDCNLVAAIQDDFKKAYYCMLRDEPMTFLMCIKCNSVTKVKMDVKRKNASAILLEPSNNGAYITLHKKCHNCK